MDLTVTPPGDARAEARLLLKLAGPIVIGSLGMMLMGTIDVLVVGRLGGHALAALSLGNTWSVCCFLPLAGVLSALDPVVSQAHGAGDQRAAGLALARGLLIALALSVPLVASQYMTEQVLALMDQPAELLADTAAWCEASSWGLPFSVGFWALRAWLQATGHTRPAAVAILLANVVNLGAAIPLAYGVGDWAGLGVVGAGWATTLARFASFALLAWISRAELRAALAPLRWDEVRSPAALGALLSVGIPLGAQLASEVWAFNAVSFMMGWISPEALAANGVVLTLASISFMLPMSISAAISVRVGNLVGAGLAWARSAWTGVGLGAGVMVFSAALFLLLPRPISLLFTQDPAVVQLAVLLLPLAAAFQLFDGTQVSCYGALRGAGDVRLPAVANLVGYWLIGLPLGWWLAFRGDLGARGLWTGLALGLASVAALLVARLAWTIRRGARRIGASG